MTAKLMLIDDDLAMCRAVSATLEPHGYDVVSMSSASEALSALEHDEFQVVVTDINMPGVTGLEFCRRARADFPSLPVVLITAFGSMATAVAAIRAGAYDFISKPIQVQELLLTLARALEHRQLKDENKRLRDTVARYRPPSDMIGDSPIMSEMYGTLSRVTNSEVTVLITGESGTGKELVARAIHEQGPRKAGPLVAFNCAAIPYTMLESELFGHTRGAFTDAKTHHEGLFVQANGGTLFLDEIGEMALSTQVKLLRALQERKVRAVGSEREVSFDARVISATNRDLETDVAEQRFREDLYYRINVIRIDLPPLRARGNDVLLIAEHFVRCFAQRAGKSVTEVDAAAAKRLLSYPWPGNVRELQNCIERAVALTESAKITSTDLPDHIRNFENKAFVLPLSNPSELLPMSEVERQYVLRVLQAMEGSKSRAATVLGFDRRTLYRKLKRYGVS
jgi:two-component system response regulator HydG